MPEPYNWQNDLEEYIRQGEPAQAEKSAAWQTAIGLQAVDGLEPSGYLIETAKEHIAGAIDMKAAQQRIYAYYEARGVRTQQDVETKEADIVAVRIAELLGEKTFQFSPAEWKSIHKRLFSDVFDHAGTFRKYNITKREWVLNGDTVLYASFDSLSETLQYDFEQEKSFSYAGLSVEDAVRHIAKFTSDIWQIHPFCEGNTRATAVFIIKYLRTFGFAINNTVFAENSWYFRNALVRANYTNLKNGIHATTEYLERFFENLLFDVNHDLKNRYLHIEYKSNAQSAADTASKCNDCTLNCTLDYTLDELAVLQQMKKNPKITQKALAELIGKSERTVKSITVSLQEKGCVRRIGGKRSGEWKIIE